MLSARSFALLLASLCVASGCYRSHELASSASHVGSLDAGSDGSASADGSTLTDGSTVGDGGTDGRDAGALDALPAVCVGSPPVECGCLDRCAALPPGAFLIPADAADAALAVRGQWQWCRQGVGFQTSAGLALDPEGGRAAPLGNAAGDALPMWSWDLSLLDDPGGPLLVLEAVGEEPITLRVRASACERAILLSDPRTDALRAVMVPVSFSPIRP